MSNKQPFYYSQCAHFARLPHQMRKIIIVKLQSNWSWQTLLGCNENDLWNVYGEIHQSSNHNQTHLWASECMQLLFNQCVMYTWNPAQFMSLRTCFKFEREKKKIMGIEIDFRLLPRGMDFLGNFKIRSNK